MLRRRPTAKLFAAAAALGFLSLGASPGDAASSGIALLRAAMAADSRISYAGTVTSVVYGPRTAAATVVRIEHRAPTSWRIWYVAPADAYGRLIVSNETTTYQYEPSTGRVYSNPWSESAPPVAGEFDVARAAQNYAVDLGAATSVAGRPVDTISLTSKYSGSLIERFWIDAKTQIVLRRERYHPDGSLAFKSEFDSVRYVNDLPSELFDLSVPPGMMLVQGAAYSPATTDLTPLAAAVHFKLVAPRDLPEGFQLEKGNVATHDNVEALQFVYSDGLRTFSLFESASARLPKFESESHAISVGGAAGQFAYETGVTLVSWLNTGLNFTLVGDLAPRELAKIGASLKG